MYLNPEKMSSADRQRIDRWLVANGCRYYVSVDDPVIVAGRRVYFTALCRRDKRSIQRMRIIMDKPPEERRSVRIRVPLQSV